MSKDDIYKWAKWFTSVVGALVILWQVVAWGMHLHEGANMAKKNHKVLTQKVQTQLNDIQTQQMLNWCDNKSILPSDCKREWESKE